MSQDSHFMEHKRPCSNDIYINIYIHIYVYVNMYVCMYIHTKLCIHIYIYVYAYPVIPCALALKSSPTKHAYNCVIIYAISTYLSYLL
jgi:hypothetical protein